MLVTHWGAQESRVVTRKLVSVVRFQEWGQCQRQKAKLMRSGAMSNEEQESNTLPWIGYTQDSSSCALTAATYIKHGIIGTTSRYAVPSPYHHTALLWRMTCRMGQIHQLLLHLSIVFHQNLSISTVFPHLRTIIVFESLVLYRIYYLSLIFFKNSLFPGRKQSVPPTVEPSAVLNACTSP